MSFQGLLNLGPNRCPLGGGWDFLFLKHHIPKPDPTHGIYRHYRNTGSIRLLSEKGMATTQEDQAPDRREKESGKPGVGELRKALAASQKETVAAQKAMKASQKTLRDVKRSLEKTAKKLKKTERDKELVMEAMENYKKHDLERDQDKGREHEAW